MHLKNGTLLQGGKYRIVRFIGSGGFGCTYEAQHEMLEKRVAIKEFFVKDFCNRDEVTCHVTVGTQSKKGLVAKLRKKFVDEAKALCRLEHPGIVRVTDVFEENGTAYFVMDYVAGRSLSDIVKDHVLPEAEALDYIRQIGVALLYVHSNNRLHLDIKPANIMVGGDGKAVLIDFGASKQYDEENGENTSTLMGKTPGYAPPEQMGNDVQRFIPATDIYALGATLYKALTGVTPPASNLRISGDEIRPLPPSVSTGTVNAVFAAMQLNKNKRPQSVAAFLAMLGSADQEVTEIVIDGGAQPGPKPSPKPVTPAPQPSHLHDDIHSKPSSSSPSSLRRYMALAIGLVVIVAGVITMVMRSTSDAATETVRHDMKGINYTNTLGVAFVYSGFVNSANVPDSIGEGKYEAGTYKGMYRDGLREGKGTFDTADGSNHFNGTFHNDEYANGRLTFSDKTYYEGTFKNQTYDTGKFYDANGTVDTEMKNGEEYIDKNKDMAPEIYQKSKYE